MAMLRSFQLASALLGSYAALALDSGVRDDVDTAEACIAEGAKGSSLLQLGKPRSLASGHQQPTVDLPPKEMILRNLPQRIFYINMESSTDRRAHMEESLSGFPGLVERVEAITPADLPQYSEKYEGRLAKYVAIKDRETSSDQEIIISIYLSHVLLWERLEKDETFKNEMALILEDDVVFSKDWMQDLDEAIGSAPEGWSVLKVCGWGNARGEDMVDEQWVIPRQPMWLDLKEVKGTYFSDGSPAQEWNGKYGFYLGTCGYLVRGETITSLVSKAAHSKVMDVDGVILQPELTDTKPLEPGYKIYELLPDRRVFTTGSLFNSTYDRAAPPKQLLGSKENA